MVHVFQVRNHHYIFDTGSSSLHECDENAALLLREKLGEAVDTSHISQEERRAAEEDFAELQKNGLLFAPEVQARPVKSDEVKALCLHICHDCNLRCRYCFADEGAYHSRREFMSLETAKKAIDFLIANSGGRKILETDFFGGEPLMNFEVVKQTVYYAKEEAAKRGKKFLFTLTTNGLLLKDDVAEFLNTARAVSTTSSKTSKTSSPSAGTRATMCAAPSPPKTSTSPKTCCSSPTAALTASRWSPWSRN